MDSRGAPERIGGGHACNQGLDLALTGGRPRLGRRESAVQYSRKRRRCQRRTVAGVTITRGCRQPAQTLASHTRKRRSLGRSLGRVTVRLYTASWWRKARFSRASWRGPPQRKGRSRSRRSRRVIIELGLSPHQSRQINHLPAGRSFGEGQPSSRSRVGPFPRSRMMPVLGPALAVLGV